MDVDALKVDRHFCSVRGNCVLVIAIIGPCDSAALADRYGPRTEAECAAAGEGEKGRVKVGEITDADACL